MPKLYVMMFPFPRKKLSIIWSLTSKINKLKRKEVEVTMFATSRCMCILEDTRVNIKMTKRHQLCQTMRSEECPSLVLIQDFPFTTNESSCMLACDQITWFYMLENTDRNWQNKTTSYSWYMSIIHTSNKL